MIGVCNAADPTDKEGLYAALAAIHSQLDQAGLSAVMNIQTPVASRRGSGRTGPHAQMAAEPRLPVSRRVETTPPDNPPAASRTADLSDAACGAVRDAKARGRRKSFASCDRWLNPQAKSEVIMLDRALSAFLQQLSSDRQAQDARHLTSMKRK